MDLRNSGNHILKDCMGLREGESVLIITDDLMPDSIPGSLFQAAIDAGFDPLIMKMKSRSVPGEEPLDAIASVIPEYDVIIAPTTKSLSHTQARLNASKHGSRIATLPGITEQMMTAGGITADYNEISRSAQKINNLLKNIKTVRIVTDKGTDILFEVSPKKWQIDTGICRDKGCFTNLPGGEIYIPPDNANGVYFIDGSIGDLGLIDSPIRVQVKNKEAVLIEGRNSGHLKTILRQCRKTRDEYRGTGNRVKPECHSYRECSRR